MNLPLSGEELDPRGLVRLATSGEDAGDRPEVSRDCAVYESLEPEL